MLSGSISPSVVFYNSSCPYSYFAFCRVLRSILWCLGHVEQIYYGNFRTEHSLHGCLQLHIHPQGTIPCLWTMLRHTLKCPVGDPDEALHSFCCSNFAVWCMEFFCHVVWRIYVFASCCTPEGLFSVSDVLQFGYPSAFAFAAYLWESGLAGESAYHQRPQIERGNNRRKMRCEILSQALTLVLSNQNVGRK